MKRSAPLAAALCVASAWASPLSAQQAADALDPIVVTGKRISTDELVRNQVAAAITSDPVVFAEHITVTTKNGVVTLHGIALDYWDVQMIKRISRRVAGVRRVVDDIDVRVGGD
jgi:osmotically-inducible protein OsmY